MGPFHIRPISNSSTSRPSASAAAIDRTDSPLIVTTRTRSAGTRVPSDGGICAAGLTADVRGKGISGDRSQAFQDP